MNGNGDYTSAPESDLKIVGFMDSFVATIPNDGVIYPLNTRGLGYYTLADDPAGSDRPIRAISINNDTASAAVVFIGGPLNAVYPIAVGASIQLSVNKLSAVYLRVPIAAGAAATVNILFTAMDA